MARSHLLSDLYPEKFAGVDVAVLDPSEFRLQKRKIESAYTEHFWAKHPTLVLFLCLAVWFALAYAVLSLAGIFPNTSLRSYGAGLLSFPIALFISECIFPETGIRWNSIPFCDYPRHFIPGKEIMKCMIFVNVFGPQVLRRIFIEECNEKAVRVAFIVFWYDEKRYCLGGWEITEESKLHSEMRELASQMKNIQNK